jgi:hypothetical protein
MKKTIIILFIVLIRNVAIGQSSDILIWKSDTLNLYSNPLDLSIEWGDFGQIIENKIEEERTKKSNDSEIEIWPWRNYTTEWLIENDSLFLTKIKSIYDKDIEINLQGKIIKKQNKIFADSINGKLIVFYGSCIICIGNHVGNTSVYSKETVLEFKNGVLSKKTDYNNSFLKESKLSSMDPNEYLNFIYGNVNWSKLPELKKKEYHQVIVTVKPKQNGRLKKIDWKNTYLIFNDNIIIQDKANSFIKEAVKVVKKVPDWNVVIRHGKILNQTFVIFLNEQMKNKYAH